MWGLSQGAAIIRLMPKPDSRIGHMFVQQWRRPCRIPASSTGWSTRRWPFVCASLLQCPAPSGAAKETGMTAFLKMDEPMARRRPPNCLALCLCGVMIDGLSTERLSRDVQYLKKRYYDHAERLFWSFCNRRLSLAGSAHRRHTWQQKASFDPNPWHHGSAGKNSATGSSSWHTHHPTASAEASTRCPAGKYPRGFSIRTYIKGLPVPAFLDPVNLAHTLKFTYIVSQHTIPYCAPRYWSFQYLDLALTSLQSTDTQCGFPPSSSRGRSSATPPSTRLSCLLLLSSHRINL
jgi:hypothetical protein